MDSQDTLSDKARRLQDARIKADRNFFLTWDQWVPPKLGPPPSVPKDYTPLSVRQTPRPTHRLPTRVRNKTLHTSLHSAMPTKKDQADGIAKQPFGQEVFDLCWTSESEPTSTRSGEPHYGGQTFDMCWTAQTDLASVVNALAEASTVQATLDAPIVQATVKGSTVQATIDASMVQTTAEAPTVQATAEASSAKPLGGEFEMCWDDEPYPAPIVDTPVACSSAKPDYGGQAFDMCWDGDTTPTEGQYNLCWDEPSSSKALSVAAITAEAATPLRLVATSYDFCWGEEPPQSTSHASLPSTSGQYDMCWDDRPATPAVEYQGGLDMCWGDSSAGDGLHAVHPTTLTNPASVGSGRSAPSEAPSEGSARVIARVEAGEELVTRADERLHRMDEMMRGSQSPAASALIENNQGLISRYQFARNQYVTATNDITKIQHLLQMFRQIDDPLTVLELGLKKAAG
ncbi:hypothetical protein BDR04DRAFT_1164591 [Suillus decipiens]|nr:hypothetical protein BDR04DRAFT_1164591 [Suillus decipiens]